MTKKKNYSAPEVDIEKFSLPCEVMTLSSDLDNGVDVDNPGDDWDF